jgi:PAS domain S-box-containing protein
VVDQDFRIDPTLGPWREEALKRGFACSISLPIAFSDRAYGALTIYANQPDAFDPEEIRLLTEMSNDLTYGIQSLRSKAEQMRAEEALVQSEERFRQIAETIEEVFWISDPFTSKMIYLSPAFERVWGRSVASLFENPDIFVQSIHPDDRARVLADLEVQKEGLPFDHEYRIMLPDGAIRWIWDRAFPAQDAAGKVIRYVGVALDVTERKVLETQLRQAAKMEAVGQLAGGVAHDFNNLLTIINGYSEIVMENLDADAKSSAYLKEVRNAGERATSLTRQLLAFSRQQVLTPQVLNLNTVVSNVQKMLRRLIGEDIELCTILDPSLSPIKADPGQLEQVIINLAVNARDAMPTGGTLSIETSNVELGVAYAQSHPNAKLGPHVVLSVADTGVGMTPETKAHIFEPFFTTKEQGKGTGLGLATVYGIVKQSEGFIWVYSELGQGSVFKIYLPIVNEGLSHKGVAKVGPDSSVGTETILLVEDEDGVRSPARLALSSAGYQVLDVKDGKSALAVCSSFEGPIHLLLTDVVMPQMSGPEVASKVAANRPGIRVLYMSGYTDDAVVRHGVLSHDMPFIQKPFSPATLRQKIRQVLNGKPEEKNSGE